MSVGIPQAQELRRRKERLFWARVLGQVKEQKSRTIFTKGVFYAVAKPVGFLE